MNGGKKFLLLIILVVVILAGLHFSAGDMYELTPLESAIRDLIAPVQRLAMVAGHEVKDFFAFPVKLVGASRYTEELEQNVSELEGKLLLYEETTEENIRLKQLLGFKNRIDPQMSTVAAAVIGRDPGNWFGSIIIDTGSSDGIKSDMAVITPSGLVGRITKVSDNTAEVLLITDPRSGVGCLVQDTRAPGIVEGVAGGQGELQIVNIPADLAPEKDNIIITSGLGSVYPKGIPVGIVSETRKENSGLFRMAVLEPYVDFNRLEEVLVVTSVRSGSQ